MGTQELALASKLEQSRGSGNRILAYVSSVPGANLPQIETAMRRSILLSGLSILLLAGCGYGPFGHRNSGREDGTGMHRKLVVEKRPASILVAFDRTVCMVDARRYRDVQLRQAVWCNWQTDGPQASTPVAVGGSSVAAEPKSAEAKPPARSVVRPREAKPRPAKKRD